MSGLTEVTEATMIAAHKSGQEYWKRNKPRNATRDNLASLARSKGWHDGDCDAWLAGFYGAWRREDCPATRDDGNCCEYHRTGGNRAASCGGDNARHKRADYSPGLAPSAIIAELKEREAKQRFLRLALELEMMQANDMGWLSLAQAKQFHKAAETIRRIAADFEPLKPKLDFVNCRGE